MILALLAAAAAASTADCENARTQTAMNICAGREYARADAPLNSQWQETAAPTRAVDAAHKPDDGRPG